MLEEDSAGIHPAYGQIPIVESGEPLVEIPQHFPRLLPHPYEAAGAPYHGQSPWFLRAGAVQALEAAQTTLMQVQPGWRIAIFDAWRPLAVQAFMVWRQFRAEAAALGCAQDLDGYPNPEALATQDPALYAQLAPRVYRFWGIANPDPAHPPPHSTGAALDCTLVDAQGNEIPMGGPVDDFTDRAEPAYFADAPPGSPEAQWQQHRVWLRDALQGQSFAQHPGEWWHFSLGDQLWAWRMGQSVARYGRINTPVDDASTAPVPTA
ncbi:M15 family metallopeptidase [Acidithiobacillus sp. IBUN Pt1247-S3]|uniref:M15 family metallopeptidase n=1 Tax=Acidithiobacillus sp. IBUN Pt1247-S3 TaxID=3166642 RepID=UPI0034E61589